MIKSYMVLLIGVLAVSACRSRSESGLRDDEQSQEDKLTQFEFDWLKQEDSTGQKTPLRKLSYCFDKNVGPIFREAVTFAVAEINTLSQPDQADGWSLTRGGAKETGDCPKEWDLLFKRPDVQDHLRFREDATMNPPIKPGATDGESDFLHAYESYRIDRLATDPTGPVVQFASDNHAGRGLLPVLPVMESAKLAEFVYEKLFNHEYIIAGEIVFNTNEDTPWDESLGSRQGFDPDLVALHMIGHALRLNHDLTIYPDVQSLPCGAAQAPSGDNLAVVALEAAPNTDLTTKPLGDDKKDGDKINVGANETVDTSKIIPVLFPYSRIGNHCANPTGTKDKHERVNFTAREIEALKLSAQLVQKKEG